MFSAQRDNDDVPQIYSLDLRGGRRSAAPDQPVRAARGHRCFRMTAGSLAFVSLMYPQAADDAANKALIEAHRARKSNARIFDGFPIRSWDRLAG